MRRGMVKEKFDRVDLEAAQLFLKKKEPETRQYSGWRVLSWNAGFAAQRARIKYTMSFERGSWYMTIDEVFPKLRISMILRSIISEPVTYNRVKLKGDALVYEIAAWLRGDRNPVAEWPCFSGYTTWRDFVDDDAVAAAASAVTLGVVPAGSFWLMGFLEKQHLTVVDVLLTLEHTPGGMSHLVVDSIINGGRAQPGEFNIRKQILCDFFGTAVTPDHEYAMQSGLLRPPVDARAYAMTTERQHAASR